jgi:hypothetical protein
MTEAGDLNVSGGFSEAERDAMKQRAEELRAERGGRKKSDNLQAALDAIAEMPDGDRVIAERIHAIVTRVAPHLLARTWYGMPAYADGKDVVCFFQAAAKFDARSTRRSASTTVPSSTTATCGRCRSRSSTGPTRWRRMSKDSSARRSVDRALCVRRQRSWEADDGLSVSDRG